MTSVPRLAQDVVSGNRRALSKALTLVESSRMEDRSSSLQLLQGLLEEPHQLGHQRTSCNTAPERCFTIGFSGPPGAGKSSLIEAIGYDMVKKAGHKVAVLAYDPSSHSSGGAILGDKFRMPKLSALPDAYIRPAPSRGTLGGVSRSTLEAIMVLQAAGFTRILVETVGVGQSEISASNIVDCLCLVMPPVGGDELQNIKRGITEVADIIAVNKADGPMSLWAEKVARSFETTIPLGASRRQNWQTSVLPVSARTGRNLDALGQEINSFFNSMTKSGELKQARLSHLTAVSWTAAEELLIEQLRRSDVAREMHGRLTRRFAREFIAPSDVGQQVVAAFLTHVSRKPL